MSPILANRLARICAYSSQAPEWEQLVRMVTPIVALSARRVSRLWGDASDSTVSEIVQNVFLKLCEDERRVLREFQEHGEDSFLQLLRVVTANVATDHFRRARADKRGGRSQFATQTATHPLVEQMADSRALDAVQWPTLIAQLDGLLRLYPETVSLRDRNMFWLHYRQGMTAVAISRIPAMKLSADGVESALKRMRQLLRAKIASGRPISRFSQRKQENSQKLNGLSAAVAIDSVKDR